MILLYLNWHSEKAKSVKADGAKSRAYSRRRPGKPDYRKGKPGESQGRKVMGLKADACLHVSERTARQPKKVNPAKAGGAKPRVYSQFPQFDHDSQAAEECRSAKLLGSVPGVFVRPLPGTLHFFIHNELHPEPAVWQRAMKAR